MDAKTDAERTRRVEHDGGVVVGTAAALIGGLAGLLLAIVVRAVTTQLAGLLLGDLQAHAGAMGWFMFFGAIGMMALAGMIVKHLRDPSSLAVAVGAVVLVAGMMFEAVRAWASAVAPPP